MLNHFWVEELPMAITVCNSEGIILYMNRKACEIYSESGGKGLIGRNLLECHRGAVLDKLRNVFKSRTVNCYMIEKGESKKMVYQTPWYENDTYMGYIEFIMEIPDYIPKYKR